MWDTSTKTRANSTSKPSRSQSLHKRPVASLYALLELLSGAHEPQTIHCQEQGLRSDHAKLHAQHGYSRHAVSTDEETGRAMYAQNRAVAHIDANRAYFLIYELSRTDQVTSNLSRRNKTRQGRCPEMGRGCLEALLMGTPCDRASCPRQTTR